jgi:surface carbohydrate biosynthesis protein
MISLKKIKKLIYFILYSKFDFIPPKKIEYLIFDGAINRFFLKKVFRKNYSILYTRGEVFNLFILIKNYLNLKFSLIEYFESYIKHINPKFIMTFVDNNILFYKLKVSNNVSKISIQSAWRTSHDDDIINFKKNTYTTKFKVDFHFSYNKNIGKVYSRFIDGKIIPIGSFQSNTIKKFKGKKIFDILYISSWNDLPDNYKIAGKITWSDFNQIQNELVKHLYDYALKYNKKFYILGKRNNPNEKIYYQKILGKKKWGFIDRTIDKNGSASSFKYIDLSKVVITLNSSLGYESLSRGNKTIFFSLREKYPLFNSLKFGWPAKLNSNGIFWTNKLSFFECEKLINNVLEYNTQEWSVIINKYLKKIIETDYDNKKFRKICNL